MTNNKIIRNITVVLFVSVSFISIILAIYPLLHDYYWGYKPAFKTLIPISFIVLPISVSLIIMRGEYQKLHKLYIKFVFSLLVYGGLWLIVSNYYASIYCAFLMFVSIILNHNKYSDKFIADNVSLLVSLLIGISLLVLSVNSGYYYTLSIIALINLNIGMLMMYKYILSSKEK